LSLVTTGGGIHSLSFAAGSYLNFDRAFTGTLPVRRKMNLFGMQFDLQSQADQWKPLFDAGKSGYVVINSDAPDEEEKDDKELRDEVRELRLQLDEIRKNTQIAVDHFNLAIPPPKRVKVELSDDESLVDVSPVETKTSVDSLAGRQLVLGKTKGGAR